MSSNSLAVKRCNPHPVLADSGQHYEISVYNDELATNEQIILCAERLRANFTKQTNTFWAELQKKKKKMGLSGKRLADAVDYVICNHKYDLKIADVVQFDKKRKVYTYRQIQEIINREGCTTDDFEITDILDANGKRMWVER